MNPILKQILKYSILYPFVLIRNSIRDSRYRYLARNNPEQLIVTRYKKATGQTLNIRNPQSLQEKITYLSLYSDTTRWSELSDKIKVREYVSYCGFSHILNELYGVYDSPYDIDYSNLPKSFVLKTNHACATYILVRNKSQLNYKKTNKRLLRWLNHDYGFASAQPHYSRIEPKILAEKYLLSGKASDKSLPDYKYFCFKGTPKCIYVLTDRLPNTHCVNRMFYDMKWQPHPEWILKGLPTSKVIPKPPTFDTMTEIASILSSPFPFVRVDFYEVERKVIFGEMTFTPGYGTISLSFLDLLGKEMDISSFMK